MKQNKFVYCIFSFLFLFLAVHAEMAAQSYEVGERAHFPADRLGPRIQTLLRSMTLEEKIGQMTLFTSSWDKTGPTIDNNYLEHIRSGRCGAVFNAFTASYTRSLQKIAVEQTRLKIPLLFGYDVIHGHRTIFPIPLAESCSWDLKTIEGAARIAAIEASAEGIHWTFAPMVDIARDPRWGRVSEGAGEDTWLGSQIAKARVKGFQGSDLSRPDTIVACAKHFAAYGAPQAGRDYHTVDLSERSLEETYLPPYKACVDAGARTVMTAFNDLNGIPCTGNKKLLTEILRNRWGFSGFVVTDYTSINELIPHGFAQDLETAGLLSVQAGVDMDMQGGVFLQHLAALVKTGKVSEEIIDEAVRRILRVKGELGLFDDPYRYCDEKRESKVVMNPGHLRAARETARKSIVLLKNAGNVLPLRPDIKKLAVIGPLATATVDLLGNWHGAGDGSKVVSILQAVRERVSPLTTVLFARGCDVEGTKRNGFREAVRIAQQADAVLLILGEREGMSGEAASRADIDLPGVQNELVEALAKTGRPIAAVVLNGRPLAMTRLNLLVPAILEAWFPGTEGGKAVVDLLFGDYSPSGKLTMTFPRSVGQIPIHYNMKNTGRPESPEKYTSKYIDIQNSPLFPFGHGLTYTTFLYKNLEISSGDLVPQKPLKVRVDVTNSGSRACEETVQLYVRDRFASVTRPVKELRGFQKILLRPGETGTVNFDLTIDDFAFYRADGTFGPEPGECEVMVGGDSQNLLKKTFNLKL